MAGKGRSRGWEFDFRILKSSLGVLTPSELGWGRLVWVIPHSYKY